MVTSRVLFSNAELFNWCLQSLSHRKQRRNAAEQLCGASRMLPHPADEVAGREVLHEVAAAAVRALLLVLLARGDRRLLRGDAHSAAATPAAAARLAAAALHVGQNVRPKRGAGLQPCLDVSQAARSHGRLPWVRWNHLYDSLGAQPELAA